MDNRVEEMKSAGAYYRRFFSLIECHRPLA